MAIYKNNKRITDIYNQDVHIHSEEKLSEFENDLKFPTGDEFSTLENKVADLQLFKFPNATIIGEPTVNNGQISKFSNISYLQFPFILDLRNQAFQIDFSFTTAANVTTQQNILDSKFGLALAISGGKGLMAISSNGTSWDIGSIAGTMDIRSYTTYYARLTWDGIRYKTFLSTNGVDYIQDMTLVGVQAPYPTTIFIGGCDLTETGHAPHPFLGTINLNNAFLTVNGNIVWSGMDDAGLSTRLAVDMSNIDSVGIQKIINIVKNSLSPLVVHSSANVTAGGYSVPKLTADNVVNAYNSVIAGKAVIITDKDETMHAFVNQADSLNDEVSIGILYYSYALLTYTLSGDNVAITVKEIS